ncbi:MAG TPA: hypothetical protein VF211_02405 [Burkholderiales bacterium]
MEGEDVEGLLRRERRERLPLARQVLLYLDPFALFKDASTGSRLARECALQYNRAMRWMLIAYIQRWVLIAAVLFLGITPAEALAAHGPMFILPAAAFAVGTCLALTVTAVIVAVYFLLGMRRE